MKRFYRRVAVEATGDGDFRVTLDGRRLRTPAATPLVLPSRALAEAVAEEWRRQGDEVAVEAMPLMRLSCTGIDRVAPRRAAVVAEIAGFAQTDLVCYRAEAPPTLVERQHRAWQPLIDWSARRHGARLRVVTGVMPRRQPPAALKALKSAVEAHDDLALAALWSATAASGSLIIALALAARRLDGQAAFKAAQIDEDFQIERWGEEPVAARRRDGLRAEIETADRFLRLLPAPGKAGRRVHADA
ncbi:MAG: ATP12 family chaperone protein [Kiloniellales bacterium]